METSRVNQYIKSLVDTDVKEIKDFVYIKDGIYYNDLFGINFEIPENWYIANIKDIKKAFYEQKFVGEYEHHKEKFDSIINDSSLFVTKYDPNSEKYYGLVTPTLNFSIIAKEPDYIDLTLKEYSELLANNCGGFGYHMLKNFRIIKRGEIYNRDGFNYLRYDTEYLFENNELEIVIMVELSVLNIDYGDFFLDFSVTECKCQNQIVTQEFLNIINSINLSK